MLGLYGATAFAPVHAQATTGTIFGQAPIATGETIQITGGSGFNRAVQVDKSGRYSVTLPIGAYDVTLLQNGQAIQTHKDVVPNAGGAIEIDFATASSSANAQNLSTVTVTANTIPAIDVTSTRESTVITAEQLQHLPLARSSAAIALLAPGAVPGAAMLGGGMMMGGGAGATTGDPVVSFGGASVAENAYYINGFNTSDPLGNTGGISLPYGSIAQQETLTSGYGAEYGRSAGGVISQVGKSGTNDWHFGGQVLWQPAWATSDEDNIYWSNPRASNYGQIYDYQKGNSQWNTVYDAYVGGPLIKDTLFFFISAEADKTEHTSIQNVTANAGGNNLVENQHYNLPKFYAKLDWNINANNTLSLTGVKNSEQFNGSFYNYDYTTHQTGALNSLNQSFKNSFGIWIAKYTSYITDNLTLNAMYGKMDGTYYTVQPPYAGFDPALPSIINANLENPAYTNGASGGIANTNVNTQINDPNHKSTVSNLRVDLEWKLGNHDIKFGIDNDTTNDVDAGNAMTGPGYAWEYNTVTPGQPVVGTNPSIQPYVGPSASPYVVNKYIFITQATIQVTQRAQYLQDNWQVTPNLLLNLGLRNDQFTNYNPDHVAYLRLTSPQWSPRIGFSWDVFGDSTLKVFGNAGRYYLAMPAGVALREAAGSLYTNEYYNYTGIDANGVPTGLTPLPSNPAGAVSTNNEYGEPLDPKTVASSNLKAEYQDEFVLGMQQQINKSWVYGVTGMWRTLGRIIDDVDDTNTECAQLLAQNPGAAGTIGAHCANVDLNGSVLINPGSTNTFRIADGHGGYYSWTVSPSQFGFPKVTRKYGSLEMYLEHPFDGTWYGKIDYVYSHSFGTTEGPVQSNIGQGGNSGSATTQWDFGSLMQYANGDQANDRRHVLKAYGTYQIAPEWTASGIYTIASGTPNDCLGFFGPNQSDPTGYATVQNGSYHWCGGQPAAPGSTGRTPWTHQLNLSVEYRPLWAGKKLGFQAQVHNVFNEQKYIQVFANYGTTTSPNSLYMTPVALEAPRYVQFGITYDW
ncbi:TonB-dependent receptor [Rhodanobacter sp. DHG33]|nr:TonB-dependent receptor [Rhodanobacter sp. DHG33]